MFLHALLHCWSEWRATRCPTCYGNVSVICKHYRNLGITKTCASWWVQMTTVNSKFKCYCKKKPHKSKKTAVSPLFNILSPPVGPPDQYIRHFTGCLYIFSSQQKKSNLINFYPAIQIYILHCKSISEKIVTKTYKINVAENNMLLCCRYCCWFFQQPWKRWEDGWKTNHHLYTSHPQNWVLTQKTPNSFIGNIINHSKYIFAVQL